MAPLKGFGRKDCGKTGTAKLQLETFHQEINDAHGGLKRISGIEPKTGRTSLALPVFGRKFPRANAFRWTGQPILIIHIVKIVSIKRNDERRTGSGRLSALISLTGVDIGFAHNS